MVGGTDRFCTALLHATQGRIVGKLGAEGVYGITVPSEGLGIAVKVQDGGIRAGNAAAMRVLDLLGLLDGEEVAALDGYRRSLVHNTLGQEVGEISGNFSLSSGGGKE